MVGHPHSRKFTVQGFLVVTFWPRGPTASILKMYAQFVP